MTTGIHRKVQGHGPWVAKNVGISQYSSDLDELPVALSARIVTFHAGGQVCSCSFALQGRLCEKQVQNNKC